MAGHHLAHAVRVECATIHAAVGLGHEDQLDPQLLRIAHRTDDVLRTAVLVVELELEFRRQRVADELVECVEHHHQRVGVETSPNDVAGCERERIRHSDIPFDEQSFHRW